MKKNIKKIMVATLAMSTVATGISAYFTATDTAINNFNVKGVDVLLEEPNYVDDQDVTPNETIEKDPTITNVGTTAQFVFASVKVPYANIETANLDGTRNVADDIELFTWNTETQAGVINTKAGENGGKVNEGWTLIEIFVDVDNGMVEYIYALGTEEAMTSLATDAVSPKLFNSVTMCNAIEGQGLENTEKEIEVTVYAIQDSDLKGTAFEDTATVNPKEVYNIYASQWNSNDANADITVIQ